MAMDEDEEDFVFFGTPIEREEDTSARKRKAVADAGQLRSLPLWKQEVRDEEGRRRFHGAFTGGFSAGYYNTAGSKEGWAPQTFTSSRKNRAEVKKQSIYNFLDEDDIKDMGGHALETSMQFDTFGFTAAEFARKQAEKEQLKRPSAIPGPVPDEIVTPASNSIGIKLLLKMGWRHGHSIKDTHADSLYGARREARKAFLAFSGNERGAEPTQVGSSVSESEECAERGDDDLYSSKRMPEFVLQPKQDLYGLGYDPYKHAPEFREKKRLRESKSKSSGIKSSAKGNLLASNSGKYAPGFGIGALEELDFEDEDIYASGFDFEQTEVEEDEPVAETRVSKYRIEDKKSGSLCGFKVASSSDYTIERFHAPVIPANFDPHHKFSAPLETASTVAGLPPPEAPPPEDSNMRILIDGFATLVARCGKRFENLSKEKNRSNPLFSFLTGGDGHNYYERKLWEAKQRNTNQVRLVEDLKSNSSVQNMTAENRGRILGEKQLERSSKETSSSVTSKEVVHLQSNLSDTFTKPASLVGLLENAKPFKEDPAKQERFEQFLKDKYEGGLRSMQPSGIMSENDRARERLDFEAAAEAIGKAERNMVTTSSSKGQFIDLSGGLEQQFISSAGLAKHQIPQDEGKMSSKVYPKREEFQWRPLPILCKRFDLIDPFMGKPAPLPRPRSKMETLFFMTESTNDVRSKVLDTVKKEPLHISQSELKEEEKQLHSKEPEIVQSTASVQKPVDLYKAIFSDDSDDDAVDGSFTKVAVPVKKSEGANMALNRLVAEDFLESLGKELGLEVPPDVPSKPKGNNPSILSEALGTERNEKFTSTPETQKTAVGPVQSDALDYQQRYAESTKNNTPTGKSVTGFFSIDVDGGNHGNGQKENLDKFIGGSAGVISGFHEEKTQSQLGNNSIHSRYHHGRNSTDTSSSSGDQQREKRVIKSRSQRGRSKTPDSSSSDGYRPKRNKSHSRHHRRCRTSDTDSSYDEYRSKRRISHSRHHRRSRTPDTGCSSDSQDHFQSRSKSKKRHRHERSKKHGGHSKRKRRTSPNSHSGSDDTQVVRKDSEKDQKHSDSRKHSVHSKSVQKKHH
ncbi:G patch domain-containing protein [Canna indica]|uniref:G patch domain-containing protein n=1 Tax=Canna indica TaxID=4628 RepID=A0AAQ3KG39_9LILI|nr:G patch domain-containing protein [Canna indica]